MSTASGTKKIVQRLPLPWAVTLTVIFALPFGLYLGAYNFTLWVCFIAWAEYFALGATPGTWKLVAPSIPAGAATGALWMATATFVTTVTKMPLIVGLIVGTVIWITALLYLIPKVPALTQGTLAVFNGLAVFLGVYFTGSCPKIGIADPYGVIVLTFVWTVLMAYFGWFLGWLNIQLTFPHEVTA